MCGVAGLIGAVAAAEPLDRMLDAIEHRGPDGRGHLLRPGLAAGMVRLAIIDVAHGDQPKWCDTEDWAVLLNGEIYNHVELREELASCGRSFQTRSDTEVVANAIAEWGVSAFERLDGMFAIAAWHEPTETILLTRDRFGEKPIYYRDLGADGLAFASEAKALAAHRPLGDIDSEALAEYLRWGYIPAPLAAWHGVKKVLPGAVLRVSATGHVADMTTYWSPAELVGGTHDGDVDELEDRLRNAVRRTLVSDVEVGVLLSGGIDSSLTAWLASEMVPDIRSFTVRFEEASHDESVGAGEVARALGIDNELLDVGATDARALVRSLAGIYDEPYADQSAIPTILLCRAVSRHVKVALGGDGADELFSGYTMYTQADMLRRERIQLPAPLLRSVARLSTSASVPLSRIGNGAAMRSFDGHSPLLNVRRMMAEPLVERILGERYEPPKVERSADVSSQDRRLDLTTYLPNDILVKVDRASMSTGLEVRTPWLQPSLVEWAIGLDASSLGQPGGKSLPRALAARRFGTHMASRRKKGFGIPLPQWLRGPLRPVMADVLSRDSIIAAGMISPDSAEVFIERLLRGRDSAARPVWTLLVLHLWHASGAVSA